MLSTKLSMVCTSAAIILLAAGPAVAAIVNIGTTMDNSIFSENTNSNGAGAAMFAGQILNPPNPVRRALLAFDVAGNVPSGSTINSVTLALFCSNSMSADHAVSLHRVTAAWGEGTSSGSGAGAPPTTNDATWTHRLHPSTAWTTAGGDFLAGASASQNVGVGGVTYTWGSSAGMVADVQGWLDTPASNFGWLIRGNETTPQSAKGFATREAFIPAQRPVLTIDYTAPSSVTDWALY